MLGSESREWSEFTVDELFSVSNGKRLETRNKVPGRRPFVGAADNGNGVTGFVDNDNTSKDRNVLGVNYNGAPCIAFYHPYECVFSDDVKRLHLLNHDDGEQVLLYFSTILSMQRSKYSYGYKFKERRMLRQKLLLPVTESGEPDYAYMERYISSKRGGMLMRYRKFAEDRLADLEYKEIPALDEKEWSHFKIPSVFNVIQRGKRLKNADHLPGETPYVSSTANNNGVDDYIEIMSGTRVFDDCISLANSGSVGVAFYEPFAFVASDHVTALKADGMSKYEYIFIAAAIMKQRSNFNFNREINDSRIRNMQIMLPVTDSNEPDYDYMEQYAKNLMLRKYEQYLTFLSNRQKGVE